jgi:surface polysaccharide O-acyltransferase-like enzyme
MGNTKNASLTKTRNHGIDLLRLLAMFFIVLGHVLSKGNILNCTSPFSVTYELLWLLKIITICAVNTFGIISGYVGYAVYAVKRTHRYSNSVYLWMKVVLYSVIIAAVFYFLPGYDESPKQMIKYAFPVVGGFYWYFNAYLGCSIISPFINRAVDYSSTKQLKATIILGTIIFSVIGTLSLKDAFTLEYGYSVLWLCILYFIGAVLNKYYDKFMKNLLYKLSFVGCVVILWLFKLVVELVTARVLGKPDYGNILNEYTSLPVVIMAVCLVIVFSNMSINEKIGKIISSLSLSSFFVYIIHMHPLILSNLIQDKFSYVADYNAIIALLYSIMIAVIIFSVSLIIDYAFSFFLNKLNIKEHLNNLEKRLIGELWR